MLDVLALPETRERTAPASPVPPKSAAALPISEVRSTRAALTEATVSRFLNEVSQQAAEEQRGHFSFSSTVKMAIEIGAPRPQDHFDFLEASTRFIEAAGKNNVGAMQQAERDMTAVFGVSWDKVQAAYNSALICAAENDAFGATTYILQSRKQSFSVDKQKWQGTIEAAYITACRHNSYEVVGLYLSDEIGENYFKDLKLRPEVLAWGIYRSNNGDTSQELLAKLEEKNPTVAALHKEQMRFLMQAQSGEVDAVHASLSALKWKDSPFVVREAAEKAIKAEQKGTLDVLLPSVPIYWQPELIFFSAAKGRVDMVDRIIEQIDAFRKLSSGIFMYADFNGPQKENYYTERLLDQGIRGAASCGKLECLKTLAERRGETGRSKIAALSAIENNQTEVLAWAITDFCSEKYKGLDSNDKSTLRELMTLALKLKNGVARDLLLSQKGSDSCVHCDHVENTVVTNDSESFYKLLQAGTSRFNLALTLAHLGVRIGKSKNLEAKDIQDYLLELFARTAPLKDDALKSHPKEREQDVRNWRSEGFAFLGSSNDHAIILTLLERKLISDGEAKAAFYNAAGHNSKEAFDLLLPLVDQAAISRTFKAIAQGEDSWRPARGSRRFLPALMNAADIEPEVVIGVARSLCTNESPVVGEKQTETHQSPATLSVINHPKFPESALNELYIEVGLGTNQTVLDLLETKPGINPNLKNLYSAVRANEPENLASIIQALGDSSDAALKNAASHCHYHKKPECLLKMIETAPHKLDLEDLGFGAIRESNTEILKLLISKGMEVSHLLVRALVDKNDMSAFDLIKDAKNGPQAAREYLGRHDEDADHLYKEWVEARTEIIAALRALAGEALL